MPFGLLTAVAAAVAGGIASVAGFGIGSLLTPLLAVRVGTKLAAAAGSRGRAAARVRLLLALGIWMLAAGGS